MFWRKRKEPPAVPNVRTAQLERAAAAMDRAAQSMANAWATELYAGIPPSFGPADTLRTYARARGEALEVVPLPDRMATRFVGDGFSFEVTDTLIHAARSPGALAQHLQYMFDKAVEARDMARRKPIVVKELMNDLVRAKKTKERIVQQLKRNMDGPRRLRVDSGPFQNDLSYMQMQQMSGARWSSATTAVSFVPTSGPWRSY